MRPVLPKASRISSFLDWLFWTSSRSGRSESGQGFENFTHDLTTRSITNCGQQINFLLIHKTKGAQSDKLLT